MIHNTRLMLALGCVALTALSIPAVSTPNPRGAEPQVRVVIPRDITMPRDGAVSDAPVSRAQSAAPAAAPVSRPPGQTPLTGWPRLVSEARKYIGTNPTDMKSRWCARFMNLVLNKVGYAGTGSDAARSFAAYGEKISQPKVGAIAVLSRGRNRNLGHVGVISGFDARGNPIIISGNHGRRVGESVYPRSRVIAYVMPTTRGRAPVIGKLAPPPPFQFASRNTPQPDPRRPAVAAAQTRAPAPAVQQPAARAAFARAPVQAQARVPTPPQPQAQAQRPPQDSNKKPAVVADIEMRLTRMFGSRRQN